MTSPAPLLIVAAVPAELSIIKGRLSGEKTLHLGPMELHTGRIRGQEVATLVTGPGTVNMAGGLGVVLSSYGPRTVFLTGCGGAFSGTGLAIGDVAMATEEIHGQLGVEDGEKAGIVHPLDFLQNRIRLDQTLIQEAHDALLKQRRPGKFKVFKGPFLTVATVTSRNETASLYRNRYRPIVENMEGFAAASLCRQHAVPMMELRAISNRVGQRDRNTWRLDLAFERAQEAVMELIERGM
jgi:futalosine hydrolase